MSNIRVMIDEVAFQGMEPADRKALLEGLQAELTRVLSDRSSRAGWARSHRTPVMKIGNMPFAPGPSGARNLGAHVARAIEKGLKP
jgi:hypothetical protein